MKCFGELPLFCACVWTESEATFALHAPLCNDCCPSPSGLVVVLPATFVTAYDFLSQIVDYNDPDLEKLHAF